MQDGVDRTDCSEGLRTFACHYVRIQDHGIVTKKKKGESQMKMMDVIKEFYNKEEGEVNKNLTEKARGALEKALGTPERTMETLKSVTIGTWMVSGGMSIAKQLGTIAANAGTVVAVGIAGVFVGTEAIAAKIIDKYFRKQVFNNTMDEAAMRAYKMLLMTIKSLLQDGKSEREIIRYLGDLNGAQTQILAIEFNRAVKAAELDGAYRK